MAKNIEFKVGLFVIVAVLVSVLALGFFAYKKDVFAKVHTIVLFSKTGDDLSEGMPVVFSGFKIGKVQVLELNQEGQVVIKIKVPDRHVGWIREGSTFIVDKPLIGAARLMVFTPDRHGPPLRAGQVPEVMTVNNVTEIMKKITPVMDKLNEIADNVEQTTARIAEPQGDMSQILSSTKKMTEKFASKDSLLEMAVSDPEAVRALHDSLRRTRELTGQVDAILKKADQMMARADEGVFGKDGTLVLVNKILKDTLTKLQKVAVSLEHLNKITADISDSTTNIKSLRQDVDSTINTVSDLAGELGRKIPFRKTPEIRLP